ncbi:MAG TPA: hypothetical protein VI653_14490, partial [Steroidobacteraceae bacterium]
LPFLTAALLAACGQRDVEPVQIDWCKPIMDREMRASVTMTPEQLKARNEWRDGWGVDCKTGHVHYEKPGYERALDFLRAQCQERAEKLGQNDKRCKDDQGVLDFMRAACIERAEKLGQSDKPCKDIQLPHETME